MLFQNFVKQLTSEETKHFTEALIHLHSSKQGIHTQDSENALIEVCQAWSTYGAHFYMVHKFKPSSKNPVDLKFRAHQWIVVMPHGIGICKDNNGTKQMDTVHEWHMIRTLQYDGKRFLLAAMENNIAVDHVFYLEHFTK